MAKIYLDKLTSLISELGIEQQLSEQLTVKHYFSGAALYVEGSICASWSPSGLAFKLSDEEVSDLISNNKASPLKYFEKGNVKKGYALFEAPEQAEINLWREYFLKAINLTLS